MNDCFISHKEEASLICMETKQCESELAKNGLIRGRKPNGDSMEGGGGAGGG
jgi:hypothetical protein